MSDEDKPFVCSQPDCGMQFTNEDHLAVHMRKHDMSLALNLTQGGLSPLGLGLFTDQTPTPTKFLKNCEELGLFQELSKNPFDDSFKKAMDDPIDTVNSLHLPGTDCADLDTPQPTIPKILVGGEEIHENRKLQDKPKDLTMSSIVPKKRKFLCQSLPTSTTSEDEEEAVIGSSSTELNGSGENIVTNSVPVEVSSSVPVQSPQNVTQMAESFHSPQNVSQMAESFHSPQNVAHMPESSPRSVAEPLYSPQAVSTSGNNTVLTVDDDNDKNFASVIGSSNAGSINITSVPISSVPVGNKHALAASPLMVQVLLQLPGGQVVPVQVPASNVATSQPVVQKPQPQQIQLIRPAIQPQPGVNNLTQNSPTMILAGNTLFQTGQNFQTVTPGGLIQNTVPLTVKSPQQTNNAQTGLQTVLNQSATHPKLQAVLNQSVSQPALQTALNQSLTGSAFQAAAQSALRTILVTNKQTGIQTTPSVNNTAQILQNAITVNQTNTKPPQKVVLPGSQSYTKQRLKAAIQQQTTPSNQKLFYGGEVKSEPQWSPGAVSSSATVSSPEAGLSPGASVSYNSGELSTSESTDVEMKREKFLERNRAAAARCRQKRKHWVQTLEKKADDLSSVNNKLCSEIKKLRGEVANLKTLLLAHKDCPVTMQQRSQGQLGTEMMSLGSDLNDVTPLNIEEYTDMQAVSEDSAAINHQPTITTMDQSGSTIPGTVGLVHGDQVVIKPVSVITGLNSLGLIPKIVNLDQSIQKTSSGS
ncbi:cyclic AMP-dependent transcription factor ATF-7-like [Mercenaria mercenaria]|uniref:cyclic AMP-dependent transcription factor ATF-7-like n=1 Tax=Mercenaria mercenaria TaxID=6596 RepID=UPI00234F3B22|nr:cyclic AMP-dependent transcription factor ATF-7-like [Mercenaria mercenaria]